MRIVVTVVLALLLVACAHQPQPIPPDAVHPRSVAIVRVLPAESITLERRWLVGQLWERIDRIAKQNAFETRYAPERAVVADAFTNSLLAAARQRGFAAVVIGAGAPESEDSDEVIAEVRRRVDADLVIYVRVRDIGVFNLLTSSDYEPGIDIEAKVVARSTGYEVVNENFYYGANATRTAFWSIPSDPADRWPDFDAVMNPGRGVPTSWRKGADAMAVRIIAQIPAPAPP